MKFPLNTIFYGPPGTGKTYNTILRAAEIVENRKIDEYNEALKIFNENLNNQIEFITFHQNYGYEDFIQGLRPDIENNHQLVFDKKDGIFKQIADRALENIRDSKNSQYSKHSFETVFKEYFLPFNSGEIEEIKVEMKKVSYFVTGISQKSIDFRKASGNSSHSLSISTLKKMYDSESLLDIQGLSSYYAPLLDALLKLGHNNLTNKQKVIRKNYVIVIDEINRANISKVFGELITLIEPDKRSEGSMSMSVKLPSGDTFTVPSNLYIIGTMNTADKSISLLDIALRRRFVFEAMYPLYEIASRPIYHSDILRKINDQIIKLKGYDFQIGHSYFMGENVDLKSCMNYKVIPLLLEYFMNDEKEVKEILIGAGLNVENQTWPLQIQ
jgi:5-methylcytosine-specific restriction protein B